MAVAAAVAVAVAVGVGVPVGVGVAEAVGVRVAVAAGVGVDVDPPLPTPPAKMTTTTAIAATITPATATKTKGFVSLLIGPIIACLAPLSSHDSISAGARWRGERRIPPGQRRRDEKGRSGAALLTASLAPRRRSRDNIMVPRGGIEPPTPSFSVMCSTN